MTVTPIPDGYPCVTPWIIGKNTAGAVRRAELAATPAFLRMYVDDNLYWVQTRIEIVDDQEMMRRMTAPEFTKAMEYVQSALFMPETR